MNYVLVIIGSGLGGGLRFFLSSYIYRFFPVYFPYGTLAVNILGSIILGILIFALDQKDLVSQNTKLFVGVGFCGGLTTFSTFSFETLNLLLESEYMLMTFNILGNLFLTVLGVFIGYLIVR